jgi:GMP synthase-like glutamine amidotransferase
MQTLRVVQHHPAEGPGFLHPWAATRGVLLVLHRADLGDLPPVSTDPVVVLGGPYSATSRPDWLDRELRWLRDVVALDAPVLAICLGAQLLTLALGGDVVTMGHPEVGWTPLRVDDGETLEVLQWHEDMCVLPHAVQHAATDACAAQLFSVGESRIGMQFHAEWNAETVAELNACFGADSPLPRDSDRDRFARASRLLHVQMDRWWAAATRDGATSRLADSP